MEVLLALVVKLFGSSGIGSVIGWVGGWMQRRQDIEVRRLELADKANERTHELSLRRVDIEIMDKELASKERVASIETTGKIETAQFDAITAGQAQQFAGEGKVTAFSRFVRPFVTVYFVFVSTVLTVDVIYLSWQAGALGKMAVEQWYELLQFVVSWTFFQAGVALAWWFSVRNSQIPQMKVR